MQRSTTASSTRLAAAILGLTFLAGCGGAADGTTSETAVKSSQEQSDAWGKLKAEGKKGNTNPGAGKAQAKPFGNYGPGRR